MSQEYIPTIGIETHVQLATKSKLFCSCNNDAREAAPNTLICPVCSGLPGTLPVLNHQAIRLALRAGLALKGKLAETTSFDRKNYFYPDSPKGYQITQMDRPIVGPGKVEFPFNGDVMSVEITRAHLEEDAGKLTHPSGADYSLVDLNRAGTPLLEIVSEPQLHSPAVAKAYAQELHSLMRYAAVSEANLFYGNMRFDVNVSVAPAGELGTRSETKNLNSFKAVERAAEYEIKRQIELLEKGQKVVQETRGWDEAKGKTFSQRSKEEAHDYRYFPEPDLPPVVVTTAMVDEAKAVMPILPNQLRAMISSHGVALIDQEILIAEPLLSTLFLAASEGLDTPHAKRIAGWLVGEVQRMLADQTIKPGELSNIAAARLVELSAMVADAKLSSTAAKQVLVELINTGDDPEHIAARLDLVQVSDSGALDSIVDEVIAANPKAVADYQAGQENAHKFLIGQVMKASRGQANPPMVGDILKKKLEEQ